MTFHSFPSIEQFRSTVKAVKEHSQYIGKDSDDASIFDYTRPLPKLHFQGTCKLHGTNSAIVRNSDGTIHYQSRSRIITPTDDNVGFATTMSVIDFSEIWNMFKSDDTIILFGEWCGQGIQSGVAITQLPKMFVIFKIKINDIWVDMRNYRHVQMPNNRIYSIQDFQTFEIEIDFANPQDVQNQLIAITEQVEKECPVGKSFGVSGVGEGIVYTCTHPDYTDSRFIFKVKGEKHSVSKVRTLASVDMEKVESIKEFINMVVTENRLNQGLNYLREQKLDNDIKNTGTFLRWLYNDVIKEESDTITESGLDSKDIGSAISVAGKTWYFKILNEESVNEN